MPTALTTPRLLDRVASLKLLARAADRNGDGILTRAEVSRAAAKMKQPAAREALRSFFDWTDIRTGASPVTLDAFDVTVELGRQNVLRKDANRDGRISAEEQATLARSRTGKALADFAHLRATSIRSAIAAARR